MPTSNSDVDRRDVLALARHARRHRRTTARSVLGIVAGALVVVLVSGAAVAGIAVGSLAGSVTTTGNFGTNTPDPGVSIAAIEGGANILLVGTDTRSGQKSAGKDKEKDQNNDVNILVHLSEDHSNLSVVSFPRDMVVDVPSCTSDAGATLPAASAQMLNSTLARGGLACVASTISAMTGVKIPYGGVITWDGVVSMTNAVGGVQVCIANGIDDDLSHLHIGAGLKTLKGQRALAFLRTRHGVGDGSDLGRISSQQVYLSALFRKVASAGTLANPVKLYALSKAALSNITLSESLADTSTLVSLARAMSTIDTSKVVFLQYPTVADPADVNRVVANTEQAALVNKALRKDRRIRLGKGSLGLGATTDTPAAAAKPTKTGKPSTPATTATPTATATATPTAAPTPTSTPTASATPSKGAVKLGSGNSGQTAAQKTCSVGNG